MPVRARRSVLALAAVAAASCGSRAQPQRDQSPPELDVSAWGPLSCYTDDDCESADLCAPLRCVDHTCVSEPVICDDGDACTQDRCDPGSGRCEFEHLTTDEDGDGFYRPLPGFAPGAPGACGDDCNDMNALANPEGTERCDGVDNDCDGIVDNGALFTPSESEPMLLSGAADQGTPGGLTFSDGANAYGAVFTQRLGTSQNTYAQILPGRGGAAAPTAITDVNSDTFAGPIVGRGRVLATAWEDRRDEDYEIYFNRLNATGAKLGPDVRVSNAPGFSLRPALLEVPSARRREYRLAWEDEREGRGGRIYGQRLDGEGQLVGGNIALTELGLDPSSPALALGQERIGLIFNIEATQGRGLAFRSFDLDLGAGGELIEFDAINPDAASIVANDTWFVVAWHVVQEDFSPGPQIWGTVISERGEQAIAPRPLTEAADFARYHSLVPLGDRLILFWSEWRDGRYDIYARELDSALEPLGERRRVTDASVEAYAPVAVFGPQGEIGVMFTGRQSSAAHPHVFFTTLSCDAEEVDFDLPR